MDRSCATCMYAEPTVGEGVDLFVECRRSPPDAVVVGDEPLQLWPQVAEGDWCGEWAEKEDA